MPAATPRFQRCPIFLQPATPTTFLSVQSESGFPLLSGQSASYSLSTRNFQQDSDGQTQKRVFLQVHPGNSSEWQFLFGPPTGQSLTTTTYIDARFSPTASAAEFFIGYNGTTCTASSGSSFSVLELLIDPSGVIRRFHVNFTLHCSGIIPGLTGEIYIVANPWK